MKKIILSGAILSTFFAQAQQGMGTNTPEKSSVLDLSSTKRGLLVPRIDLTATNVASPVNEPANSLLVYNKATAGSGDTKVTPGYYFWSADANKWVRLIDGNSQNIYTAGAGMILTGNEFSRDGLEKVTENAKTGWRLVGATPTAYNGIGQFAVDLSYNPSTPEELAKTLETDVLSSGTPSSETYAEYKQRLTGMIPSNLGAVGPNSFSAGLWNSAKGASSVALGTGNVAEGDYSFVFGLGSSTSAAYSVAIGNEAKAQLESYAIGTNVDVDSYSFGLGNRIKVEGGYNVAFGNNLKVKGFTDYAIVFGSSNTANPNEEGGDRITLIGNNLQGSGSGTTALGNFLNVYSEYSTAFGIYNTEEDTPQLDQFTDKSKRLLVLGNGEDKSNKSDAFTILRNAKVGIGIDNFEKTNSDAKLQVNGKTLIGDFGDNATSNNTINAAGNAKAQLDVRGDVAVETLELDETATHVIVEGANGVLKKKTIASIASAGSKAYTKDSGTHTVSQFAGYSAALVSVIIEATIGDADVLIKLPEASESNLGQVITVKVKNQIEPTGEQQVLIKDHTGTTTFSYGQLPYQSWIFRSNGSTWEKA